MRITPYIEKLESSKEYRDFEEKYKGAFMVAGFFVLDLEYGKNMHQIDYYIPSQHKIAAFTLDKKISMQILSLVNSKKPEKLDYKTKIDLEALKGILEDEMKNRSITDEIKKIIAVVQSIEGKRVWNLNCVLSGLGILRAHVDDDSQTVLKMEKASMMDYVRRLSPGMQAPQMASDSNSGSSQFVKGEASKEQIKEKIKKLDDLEKAIEKEKQILEEEASKPEKSEKNKIKKDKK